MNGSRRAFFVVGALQILAVLGFAGMREAAVRLGTEVVLETVPVDPRDLFRGDYVVLNYRISSLHACEPEEGQDAYVGLNEGGDGVWRPRVEFAVADYETAAEQGDVVIRGRVSSGGGFGRCGLRYGIESYFVPEGTGPRLERLSGELQVRVSVGGDGDAVIKSLILPDS